MAANRAKDFEDHQRTERLLADAAAQLPPGDEFAEIVHGGLEHRVLPPGHGWPSAG